MSIREIALEFGPDTNKWPTHVYREALEEWYLQDLKIYLDEAFSDVTGTEGDCLAVLTAYRCASPVAREAIIGRMVVKALDSYAEKNLDKYVGENFPHWEMEAA
jgi:hypothetical protein